MNVAIIGSNGFIGSHLTLKLSQTPHIKLFLFGKKASGIFKDKFSYTQLDLLNQDQVQQCFSEIDVVYYLASASIPSSSWENPAVELDTNLLPFISFMESVSKLRLRKVVFISSAGTIYGSSTEKANEDAEKKPYSPHGIIKLTMEYFLNYFKIKYNLSSDIYRISNVYGEGQNTTTGLGLVNTLLENAVSDKPTTVFGNGTFVRNYVYVKDVVELLSYSLSLDTDRCHIFNIASNDTISINELIEIVKSVTRRDVKILNKQERGSDNPTIDVSNSKILAAYPAFKFTSIHDGIRHTYDHLKKHYSII